MIRKILNRWNGAILWEGEAETVKDALHAAYSTGADLTDADLRGAVLTDAVLTDAVLTDADLTDADLTDADLRGAVLTDADLRGAVLTDADLRGAVLRDADLRGADLRGAVLTDAVLTDADLRGAAIPPTATITGESWRDYLTKVVPALLVAGGKTIESFAPHWDCHSWDNCPMAFAFDVNDPSRVPPLLRQRSDEFVRLFDARLIPWPLPTEEQIDAAWTIKSAELDKARAERQAERAKAAKSS